MTFDLLVLILVLVGALSGLLLGYRCGRIDGWYRAKDQERVVCKNMAEPK